MKKLGLFAMGLKGLRSLQCLVHEAAQSRINIAFIVGAKDAEVANDYFKDIEQLAKQHHLNFFERNLLAPNTVTCDFAIAVSWKWLIDVEGLELYTIHDSLLPRYRGFNPLVTALINGDSETGVTLIQSSNDYDSGDIVAQEKLQLTYPVKVADAISMIAERYAVVIQKFIALIQSNDIVRYKQDDAVATFSLWRNDEDYKINWNNDAAYVKRFIDSVGYPYLCAFTEYDGVKLRVREADVVADIKIENRTPGKIFSIQNNQPVVVCGKGLLKLLDVRKEGSDTIFQFKKLRVRLQ